MTQGDEVSVPKKVRSVAVIGGGASGAIILDSLVQENRFEEIVLFERREIAGGVWVLDSKPDALNVPPGASQELLDPALKLPEKLENSEPSNKPVKEARSKQQRFVHTASYEGLTTNVPEPLMSYSDEKRWGQDEKPHHDEYYYEGTVIQRYIARYVGRHRSHVKFRTTVEKVWKDYSAAADQAQFELTLRTETDEKDSDGNPIDEWWQQRFDAVVVATGHYHVPHIPGVPGLAEVHRRFPDLVRHSKGFRAADSFTGQTVIVVGTRASGADIAEFASKGGALKVFQSRRQATPLHRTLDADNYEVKPTISKYEVVDGDGVIVHFTDGSTVSNPDQIIYATGFRFSYPFFSELYPTFTTGYVQPDLYLHTFFTKDPLLAVVGVPTDAISFRAFEYQAVAISRFLGNKIRLPPLREQLRWELERFAAKGNTRAYHTIDFGKKLDFLQQLTDIGGGVEPLGGTGRPFPVFSEEDKALYSRLVTEKFEKFFADSADKTK